MKVIFTCGGTGGHINPAIAVAGLLRERYPDAEILFVGAKDGMEEQLVPREGFRLETVKISGFERQLNFRNIRNNVQAAVRFFTARGKANKIIRDFRPDVIVGTGGYASYPMLRQGAKKGIPTAVHEANAYPGLATRLVQKKAARIMVNFAESRDFYRHPERVSVVGMPVREAFFSTDREEARRKLGIPADMPLVVSAWGSLGAREMNKKIADFMRLSCENGTPFCHYHATGSYGWRWMPGYIREKGVDPEKYPLVRMQEYIYNMPELMAAADLFIGRAGASSLSEIFASGLPCILVPSPNVADNHQLKNARVPESRGGAVLIPEAECTGKVLYDTVVSLLNDPERRNGMRNALRGLSVRDSASRILDEIIHLTET